MTASYLADPGGRFSSDTHRRVLGHLSTPEDNYGWTEEALLERMRPDVGTDIQNVEEITSVLEDLEADGHAQKHDGRVWQMTPAGFEVLTGPIANEPGATDEAAQPAQVGAATNIGGNGDAPAGSAPVEAQENPPAEEQENP